MAESMGKPPYIKSAGPGHFFRDGEESASLVSYYILYQNANICSNNGQNFLQWAGNRKYSRIFLKNRLEKGRKLW